MKNTATLLLAVFLLSIGTTAVAQKANEPAQSFYRNKHRQEITIPQILGYNVYTADLHTHTIYSDGNVTPELRVREAWQDGLDILAIPTTSSIVASSANLSAIWASISRRSIAICQRA